MSTVSPEIEIEVADPPPPVRGTVTRLLAWIVPANISVFVIWGAVPAVLLPLQIAGLDADAKIANLAVVTTIGAFAAMVAQPVAGTLSDRTRSRFGRRAPYLVGGALVGGLALVGMAAANTLVQIAIAWVAVQVAYNFAQGPLSAVLPDRIPRAMRGTFSALAGLGLMMGTLGGQILGASMADHIPAAYLLLAGLAVIALTVFVVVNPDHPSTDLPHRPFRVAEFLRTFWVSPVAHPDFFWAFTGRLLLYTGYFAAAGYQLYILQDYIGLGDDAAAKIPLFGLITMAGMLVSTLVSGPLSDRLGRRKPFVFASSALVGLAMLIPLTTPTVAGWAVFSGMAGLGFGMFQAVDTALMSEVLPSADDFGKDLGVVNIAATLPQTVGPAVAGFTILYLGGYPALFVVAIVLSVLGAFAVWPIKAVR